MFDLENLLPEDREWLLSIDKSCEELQNEFNPKPSFETVCKSDDGFSIIIELETHDHGRMDKNNLIKDGNSPAHAHVKDTNRNKLGKVNVTGLCPKKASDLRQYFGKKAKNDPRRKLFSSSTKDNIIKWANKKSKNKFNDNKLDTNWVCMQDLFINIKKNQK